MSSRQSFRSLNNTQRDDYNDYDEYAQRFQAAYQANVADETNENSYIDDTSDAHWLSGYQDTDDDVPLYENQSDLLDDYSQNAETAQDVNFLTSATEISTDAHNCTHCSNIFSSRNQLFKHLRTACWSLSDTFEHVSHAVLHDDLTVSHAGHAVSIVKLSSSLTVSIFIEISRKEIYELSHAFASVNRRVIQSFVRFDEVNSDYAFREYQYDQTIVKLDSSIESIKICIDIGCSVTMTDRKFLTQLLFDVFVQKLVSSISVRGVDGKIVKSDEFMLVNMTFDEMLKSKRETTGVIEVEMHFIDDFAANMLLANDVIYSQSIKIDSEKRRFTIAKCEKFRVSIDVLSRAISHVKRIIRSRQTYILQFDDFAKIFVTYHDSLSDDRDFLFEFHCQYDLEYDDDVYAHVVNSNLFKMLVRNATIQSITLAKRARLNMIIEYNQTECYLTMSKESYKAVSDWMNDRSWKKQLIVSFVIFVATYVTLNIVLFDASSHESTTSSNEFVASFASSTQLAVFTVSQIDSSLKHVLSSDVTVYGVEMFELANLMNSYQNIFRDFDSTVNIFENEWMSINLKSETVSKLNKMYSLEVKNRSFIDATFDKLH